MMKDLKILIVGVGGQGTLLASNILGKLAQYAGKDVKLSEVHGMAQRGGSVVTHVVIGEKVNSPIIDEGEADIIIAFEKLEAMRWANYLKKDGHMLVNTQEIMPMPVIIGSAQYPEGIEDTLADTVHNVICIDALKLALQAGSPRAVNIVMLGVLAKHMDAPREEWQKVIEQTVKPQFIEMNEKAFLLGYNY